MKNGKWQMKNELVSSRRHVRIRSILRNMWVAFGRSREIRHDLVHSALRPRVCVLDVRLLLRVGPQVEEPHQRRDRYSRFRLKDIVKLPVLPLYRAELKTASEKDYVIAI